MVAKPDAAFFSAAAQGRREVSGIRLGDSQAERGTIPKLGIRQEACL